MHILLDHICLKAFLLFQRRERKNQFKESADTAHLEMEGMEYVKVMFEDRVQNWIFGRFFVTTKKPWIVN